MSYYVYVLKSERDRKFYTGCTNNLRKRFSQHEKGQVLSTKARLPVQVVYYEMCLEQSDAYAREKYLKTGMGKRYINNRLKHFLSLTDSI